MSKSLHEMTNEELWQLFPIILSEFDPIWKERYQGEKKLLEHAVGIQNIARMHHYGSTAVRGLTAKPTIDILLEINEATDLHALIAHLQKIGYLYSEQPDNPAPHMMFMKGYTPQGFRGQAFHVHVRYPGDWDELYFRDYLVAHPEIAAEYGKLKLKLKEEYEHDRDGYTLAKTQFIRRITKLARTEIENRHSVG